MNVFSLLSQAARRWPDGVAVCEGERVVQTWSALEQAALALAARLFTQDANVRNVRSFFSVKRAKFDTQVPLARG